MLRLALDSLPLGLQKISCLLPGRNGSSKAQGERKNLPAYDSHIPLEGRHRVYWRKPARTVVARILRAAYTESRW